MIDSDLGKSQLDTINKAVQVQIEKGLNLKKDDLSYCWYNDNCYFKTNNKQEYEDHCSKYHPGTPCYPGEADLNFYDWKAQDKDWEKPVSIHKDRDSYLRRN